MRKFKMVAICMTISFLLSACGNSSSVSKDVNSAAASKNDKLSSSKSNTLEEKPVQSKEEDKQKNTDNVKNDQQKNTNNLKSNEQNTKKDDIKLSKSNIVSTQKSSGTSKTNYRLTNKIIVIDPGHATRADLAKEPVAPNSSVLKYKQTGGADGVITKTPEYKVNMQVALKLKDYLEQSGFTVIMTKKDTANTMSNIQRAKVGNEANASLVIRIHADSSDNKSVSGLSVLVPSNNENTKNFYKQSKSYGQVILDTIINEVGMKSRGVVERDDMTGFNWSTVPVVLVETGFLSNPQEDKKLSNSEYQDKIARSICKGVTLLQK